MNVVDTARRIATDAHAGQVDKAGRPYIEHPAAVAGLLAEAGPEAVAAGWLHDVVEDTTVTLDDLAAAGFPPAVVSAVDAVTKRPGEPYDDLVRRAAADRIGRWVKLADNANNSDEQRLALLPAATAARLRGKYARARDILLPAVLHTARHTFYRIGDADEYCPFADCTPGRDGHDTLARLDCLFGPFTEPAAAAGPEQ